LRHRAARQRATAPPPAVFDCVRLEDAATMAEPPIYAVKIVRPHDMIAVRLEGGGRRPSSRAAHAREPHSPLTAVGEQDLGARGAASPRHLRRH